MTNPVIGGIRTAAMFLTGRFQFDDAMVGKQLKTDDGAVFTIFRRVAVKTRQRETAGAYFLVRFRPLGISPRDNVKFSRLPMMVFMGFRGFRSKYWAVDYDTGLCQGLYEWQTVDDARNYARSIAMRFMARRSDPDSVWFRVVDRSKDALGYEIC